MPPYSMFRANPQHTGVYDSFGIDPTPTLLWRFILVDGEREFWENVQSSPSIADGVVYVGSQDNYLYAIDVTTGKEKWRFDTGGWVNSSPAVVNGVVYIGSWNKYIYAIDAETGKEKWKFKTEADINSSPTVVNGVLYIGSWDSNLYAIDAVTGKEKWRFTTGSWVRSSPAIADGVVYVGSQDHSLYAIDAVTGKEKWRFITGDEVLSSPAVVNGIVYVGSKDHSLYAIDVATGKEKWRFATGAEMNSSPAVVNDVVYIGSWDNNLYAIDAVTGKEKWRFTTGGWVNSSPAVVNDVVYIGSWDNNLYAIDAVTGKEKWRFATRSVVVSSPAVVNGVVYIGSWDDNLYAIGVNQNFINDILDNENKNKTEQEIKKLIKSFVANNEESRIVLLEKIKSLGDIAIKQLILALTDSDKNLRSNAAVLLNELGNVPVPYLLTELYQNLNLIDSLVELDSLAVILLNKVMFYLNDCDNFCFRIEEQIALSNILKILSRIEENPTVEDPLLQFLGHDESKFEFELEEIGEPAIIPLIRILKRDNSFAQLKSAIILGKIGYPAIPYLLKEIKGADEKYQIKIIYALGQIGKQNIILFISSPSTSESDKNIAKFILEKIKELHIKKFKPRNFYDPYAPIDWSFKKQY